MGDAERDQRADAREVQRSLVLVMQQNAQAQEQAREDERKKAKERGVRDTLAQISSFEIDKLVEIGDAGGYMSWEGDIETLLFAVALEEVMAEAKKDQVGRVSDVYMDPRRGGQYTQKCTAAWGWG